MNRINLFLAMLAFTSAALADVTPFEVVQTMEKDYGVHHGFRRNHAKGICAIGEFTATPEAKSLSRSALFNGKTYRVVARFSDAGGVPNVPDSKKIPRGLAFQANLGGGAVHNFSMINIPVFPARTPGAFHESLAIGSPEALAAYEKKYPESKPFFDYVNGNNPPASFATTSYFSLNAFKFVDAQNREQFVRWEFVPQADNLRLTDAELAAAPPNYLEEEIVARVKKAPAAWTMVVTLAQPGDTTVDPTSPWPAARKKIPVGKLKLVSTEDQKGGACDKINFDPGVLSDGVAVSDDPILRFRSPAYAISYGKRLSDPVDQPASPEREGAKRPAVTP